MTNSFTQAHWEELVSLRRENLALRLEVTQLRDVVTQRAHNPMSTALNAVESGENAPGIPKAACEGEALPEGGAGDAEAVMTGEIAERAFRRLGWTPREGGILKAFSQESDL